MAGMLKVSGEDGQLILRKTNEFNSDDSLLLIRNDLQARLRRNRRECNRYRGEPQGSHAAKHRQQVSTKSSPGRGKEILTQRRGVAGKASIKASAPLRLCVRSISLDP